MSYENNKNTIIKDNVFIALKKIQDKWKHKIYGNIWKKKEKKYLNSTKKERKEYIKRTKKSKLKEVKWMLNMKSWTKGNKLTKNFVLDR
jgi:hypothetical protein